MKFGSSINGEKITEWCACAPSFNKIMHHSCHGDAYTNEIKNLKTLNDNEVTYLSTKKKLTLSR